MNFMKTISPENISPEAIQKHYFELCNTQNVLQLRLATVERNTRNCLDENIKLEVETQAAREQSFKSAEKLKRISSLCSDLRKRVEKSAYYNLSSAQKVVDEERAKRIELNDSFAVEVHNISKRIEGVASRKQLNTVANESLRIQLNSSIDKFHVTETIVAAEESSFDVECYKSEELLCQLDETCQMEYEDYLGRVRSEISEQVALRELLASYNEKFQGFQDTLAENNRIFESHRKAIDELSNHVTAKHLYRSELMLQVKAINKTLKAVYSVYVETQKNIEKKKLKEEKILNLISVFENDIAVMELELSSRTT